MIRPLLAAIIIFIIIIAVIVGVGINEITGNKSSRKIHCFFI